MATLREPLIDAGRRVLGPRQLNHLVRFGPILTLIRARMPRGGSILDVGSGSQGLATLLSGDWQVTAVDATFDDYAPATRRGALRADQLIGDVRALPFADARHDVVVAVDLLEHVPPADRERAIEEICRVSRRLAIIACPAGPVASNCDERLAAWFAGRGQPVPGWLAEHLDHALPDAGHMAEVARRFGGVEVLGNENGAAHERLVMAEHRIGSALVLRVACRPLERLMTSRRAGERGLADRLLRAVRGADAEPTYRAVLVVDRAWAPAPR